MAMTTRKVINDWDSDKEPLLFITRPTQKIFTLTYPHQFYKKLYRANPQKAVSGGELVVYSRMRFAEEAIQGESSEGSVWGAAGGI